jgi:hypothetical protein
MSLFPEHSFWGQPEEPKEPKESEEPEVKDQTEPNGTEISYSELERWYRILNELVGDDLPEVSEDIRELRDEIYSYLRG